MGASVDEKAKILRCLWSNGLRRNEVECEGGSFVRHFVYYPTLPRIRLLLQYVVANETDFDHLCD